MKKSNPLNRTTVDLGMLRILWVADRWSVFSSSFVVVQVGVSVSVKHNNKKRTKTGSSKELPMTKQGSWRCRWGTVAAPCWGREVCPLHLFWSAEPTQKDFFPLEGKAYTFGSRTEIEKLNLTYFLSSANLTLSSQAVWKSWETDSCNQTLACIEANIMNFNRCAAPKWGRERKGSQANFKQRWGEKVGGTIIRA